MEENPASSSAEYGDDGDSSDDMETSEEAQKSAATGAEATTNSSDTKPSSAATATASSSSTRTKRSFREYFDLLLQYKVAKGNSNVPRTYITTDGIKLGQWVCRVRHQQSLLVDHPQQDDTSNNNNNNNNSNGRKCTLTPEQVDTLNAIGFTWRQPARTGGRGWPFHEKVEILRQWHDTHGNFSIPQDYKTNDGVPLGNFASEQRREYNKMKRGEQCTLTEARLEQLQAIGFDFDPVGSYWNVNLELLQQFHAEHGHANVPARHVDPASQTKLGAWCERNRQAYRQMQEGMPTTLTPERIQELNVLTFDWRSFKNDAEQWWDAYYQEMINYQKTHQSIDVPEKYVPPEKNKMKLGVWCKHQKQLYEDHQAGRPAFITVQRIDKLKSIGVLSDDADHGAGLAKTEKRRRMYEVEYVKKLEKRVKQLERLEDDHKRELESLRKHLSKYTKEF